MGGVGGGQFSPSLIWQKCFSSHRDLTSREEDKIILARMEAMKINSMSQEESVSSRQLSSSSPPSDCNSQEVTSSLRHPICLNMQPSKTNSLPISECSFCLVCKLSSY